MASDCKPIHYGMRYAMGFLWFGLGSLGTFVLGSGLSVLAQGGSFLVLCVLSLVATLLLLVGLGAAMAATGRVPARNRALLLGAASALVFVALVGLAAVTGADPARSWPLVLALPVLGAAAALLRQRSPA